MTSAGSSGAFGILGMGHYLPPRSVGNAELAERTSADSSWIDERTGILSRHVAGPGESTAGFAAEAAMAALKDADVEPDLILLATVTPDQPVPATVYEMQRLCGLHGTAALNVDASCSGFLYALTLGWSACRTGLARNVLVVGADTFSRCVDPTDQRTASLFGDGAAAFVLGPVEQGYGILSSRLWGDGDLADVAVVPPPAHRDGSATGAPPWLRMQGRRIAALVDAHLPGLVQDCLAGAGYTMGRVDRLIIHQGNVRMVEGLARRLCVPPDKVPLGGRYTGNVINASVPLTAVLAHEQQPFRRGDVIVLAAAGAGASAAVVVLRWY